MAKFCDLKKCGWIPPLESFLLPSSGKEKAHKHKQIFPVTAPGGGGSPDRVARGLPTGGQGSKVYVLCAEPKEHKHFRPGTRPGGSVTGVTEKLFMCQMFMCLFRPLVNDSMVLEVSIAIQVQHS